MGKITFILGGARSGKSSHALKLAKRFTRVAYIATAQAKDQEMKQRIKLHKQSRPSAWKTFEECLDPEKIIKAKDFNFECVIIDCLTLLVSNLMLTGIKNNTIQKKMSSLAAALKKLNSQAILVSNEVGLGIVPANKLARAFRDTAGLINQLIAQESDTVIFMVSAQPLKVK
ncbi:MAG: bifunctional adenosylcobinamide kinase/adenosylcobinamide-phosphate guanylyltransferase [Candidatus Omnitrophota bacterium]|jgi:adenosylcobinamide kinase/adenosylcobinamide-phosphate guanylyltransferase